jgi:hypothetical protein
MRVELGCGTVLALLVMVGSVLFLVLVMAGSALLSVLGIGG